MIEIDGSLGEGGGQVLRTALALSALTATSFRMFNIRAGRENPGLRPQHLSAVLAVAEVCGANVKGEHLNSKEIEFFPGDIVPGRYRFDVGTAGSAPLVLQALLPCLLKAGDDVEVEVVGGTNVPNAPQAEYMQHVLFPMLQSCGARIRLEIKKSGFYPKGGGHLLLSTEHSELGPLDLSVFEPSGTIEGVSFCANLTESVPRRQGNSATVELFKRGMQARIRPYTVSALSPGSGIVLWASSKGSTAIVGADALGARDKPAEAVGLEAARNLLAELGGGAAVDRHAADQLLPFLAVAGGGLRTSAVTLHAQTNMAVIEKFLPVKFGVEGNSISCGKAADGS